MSGWKRPMFDRLDTPINEEMERLQKSDDPLEQAIFKLWVGRSIVSSVTSAWLNREQADAILVALDEMPAMDSAEAPVDPRVAEVQEALALLWDHLHPEPRMDGSCRVTRMRIPVELVHKVHKALGDATVS